MADVQKSILDQIFDFVMNIDLDKLQRGCDTLKMFILGQRGPTGALTQIAKERYEQIHKHGHTVEKDVDRNDAGELGAAALFCLTKLNEYWPAGWSIAMRDKIAIMPYKDTAVLAAAFLAAEIDRVDYVMIKQAKEETTVDPIAAAMLSESGKPL